MYFDLESFTNKQFKLKVVACQNTLNHYLENPTSMQIIYTDPKQIQTRSQIKNKDVA